MYQILFIVSILTSNIFATPFKAKVIFKAPTNMGSTVSGEAEASGNVNGSAGGAELDLRKFDTGMSLRNRHMIEDLNAEKNPIAKVKWTGTQGQLTLNGITKPITLSIEGNVYKFDVELPVFSVKARRYMGIGIQDKVSVIVEKSE